MDILPFNQMCRYTWIDLIYVNMAHKFIYLIHFRLRIVSIRKLQAHQRLILVYVMEPKIIKLLKIFFLSRKNYKYF